MNKLISIIVPIYNVERYLKRCVDSIRKQTYSNIEIILVDDGSPDGCPKMCEEYAVMDDRIVVIHKENGGLSSARNAGIELASGEYIAFVDADDVINKKYIEILYHICEENGCDIAQCEFISVPEEFVKAEVKDECQVSIISSKDALYNSCKEVDAVKYNVTWNKLYKRDLFAEIRFPNGKIHEDEFTTYKIFYCAKKIAIVNAYLYYYVQRDDSIMNRKFSLARLNVLDALDEKVFFLRAEGLIEESENVLKREYKIIQNYIARIRQELDGTEEIIKELEHKAVELKDNLPSNVQESKVVDYICPFNAMEQNSRIIVYGAGAVGKAYYRQITTTNFYGVVLWVDNGWQNYKKSMPYIQSVDKIFLAEYDYILLAQKDKSVANDIRNNLIACGVPENKIVWKNPRLLSIEECETKFLLKRETDKIREKEEGRFFLVNTPDHGNLGDHALAIAAKQFLNDYFGDKELIEISGKQWNFNKKSILQKVKAKDVVFVAGGGYMGDLWVNEDSRVKEIIESFPHNKIIFLPQTFYYSASVLQGGVKGESNWYSAHKNILFIHRDLFSYKNFLGSIVKDESVNKLYPDLTLYLSYNLERTKRDGILLCFRADKECQMHTEQRSRIEKIIVNSHEHYRFIDTVTKEKVTRENRDSLINKLLNEIAHSRLVITDRLHGMIFAVITGTPCIAINNVSKKVEGVYKWIEKLSYVTYKKIEEIDETLISKYVNITGCCYKNEDLRVQFEQMAKDIAVWINSQ